MSSSKNNPQQLVILVACLVAQNSSATTIPPICEGSRDRYCNDDTNIHKCSWDGCVFSKSLLLLITFSPAQTKHTRALDLTCSGAIAARNVPSALITRAKVAYAVTLHLDSIVAPLSILVS